MPCWHLNLPMPADALSRAVQIGNTDLCWLKGACYCCQQTFGAPHVIKGGKEEHLFCADGAPEPVSVSKKGSKAKPAAQSGADDVSTYEGECWAFSSRYLKPTQAALQLALDAIEVHGLLYKCIFIFL